ncbi:MAG: NAD(P)-binding domain-containing protein, partial [Arenicellales bacterium]|nr:NAD(P)-binding domain-containing protein [Arenicellales bacterium]
MNDVNLSGRCIAVLGMGIMGRSMVRNLARAGAEVVVWNRTIDTARKMAGGAIRVVATPAQAARTADIRIIVVADSQALADVVLGS